MQRALQFLRNHCRLSKVMGNIHESRGENVAAVNSFRHVGKSAIVAPKIAARCMQQIAHETTALNCRKT